MTAEQLRNSILQEAISGRLVPQDPNDEPASVLLDRIDARRAELIAEGKVKPKDNVPFPIKDEDIPFELPSGWCWCRVARYTQKVTDFVASGSFASLRENVKYYDTPNYAILVRTKDFRNSFDKDLVYTDKHGYEFLENSRLFGGEMILPNIGASIGKVFIVPELPYRMTLAPNAVMTRFFFDYQRDWLYYFFVSPLGKETLHDISSATAQGKFNKTEFKQILFPLPPLAEQKRIVAKLEELLPIVEQYGKAQTELDELNAALPARLRQSILQEAISGKLVPQDENDEPVSSSAIIPEDDIPFEIPSTWAWVTMKDCAKIIGGYAFPSASIKGDKGIRVIRISDISEKGFVNKSVVRYNGSDNLEKFKVQPQDILIAMTGGTVGKSLFVKEMDEDMLLNQRVAIIRNNGQYAPYLDMVVKSPHIKSFINDKKNSTNDNISMDDIKNFLVPLPPLAEQQRIIAKIEELFAEIDKLSK